MLIPGPFTFSDLQGRRYEWRRQQDQRPRLYLLGDDEKSELIREEASLYKNLPGDKKPTSAWFERKTLEVLGCFLDQPKTELSREAIQAKVWPDGVQTKASPGTQTHVTPDETAVQKYVGYIRRLLLDEPEADGKSRIIEAIGNRSYKFLLTVEPGGRADADASTDASDQQRLRRLLKSPIYAYHLTQDPDGNPTWYHKVLNFDSSTADGRLVAHGVNLPANTTDSEREQHRYEYVAWLDRRHLIVRTRREDQHSPDMSIQVFPKVGEPHNRPPWWGMDAITTTWSDNPAMTISIWNPEQELDCARGAPDGAPISDPGITQALENVWRKAAGRARAVQLPSSIRHFKTDAEAFKHLSNLYSSESLKPPLLRIRDTHARSENRPLGFGDNYVENGAAFGTFLARGDQHATRAVVILGDKVDENYVRSFLLEPVKGHEHQIDFFRLPTPILSFIILDYADNTHEVFFGWGRLVSDAGTGVFASKDQQVVQAFSHYFDMLKVSAQPVPAAALANPAQLHRERTPLPWLYNTETSDHAIPPLHAVESAARGDSVIYVVTPDLYNDARNPETIAMVRANHQRGITYKFFAPDSPKVRINIKLAMQNYAESAKHESGRYLSFIYLASEMFQIPQCNVLVIEHDKDGRRRVFVELPVHERAERRWWAETDPDTAEWWHTKVKELAKRKPLSNPHRKS